MIWRTLTAGVRSGSQAHRKFVGTKYLFDWDNNHVNYMLVATRAPLHTERARNEISEPIYFCDLLDLNSLPINTCPMASNRLSTRWFDTDISPATARDCKRRHVRNLLPHIRSERKTLLPYDGFRLLLRRTYNI